MTSKVKSLLNRLRLAYRNQPEISFVRRLPKPTNKPAPFKLEGEILFRDDTPRKIGKGGNSIHVTFPSIWGRFLDGDLTPSLFEAYGRRGLIFVCEGGQEQ